MAAKKKKKLKFNKFEITNDAADTLASILSDHCATQRAFNFMRHLKVPKALRDDVINAHDEVASRTAELSSDPSRMNVEDCLSAWNSLEIVVYSCFEVPDVKRGRRMVAYCWELGC